MSERVAVPTVAEAVRALLDAFAGVGMTAHESGTSRIVVWLSDRRPKSISVSHDRVRKSHFRVTDGSIAPQKIVDKVSAVIADVASLRAADAKRRTAIAADDKIVRQSLASLKNKVRKPASVVASRVVNGEARHDVRINDLDTTTLDNLLGALETIGAWLDGHTRAKRRGRR